MRSTIAACGCLLLVVAGCSQLPAAGPSHSAIVQDSTDPAGPAYALVPVEEAALDILDGRGEPSFGGTFAGAQGGTSERIGVGDTVIVSIWEAANGGLFSTSNGSLGGGSKSTVIPAQPVAGDGTVSIPYAGAVQAAGRTPAEVKAAIEAALAGKAIEPQVLVRVEQSLANKVTVTGDVSRGGLVPLSARGTRILDAIAAAGSIAAPAEEIMIELARGGRSVRVPLARIISEPSENVMLRADDVVAVLRQPQSFTAYGATGENARVTFPLTGMTLEEGIARVGGLLDLRADPAGVFVFRYENRPIAERLDPAVGAAAAGATVPVVYQIDLRDPRGFFRAKRFRLADGDLVYVANANLNEIQKFSALINGLATPTLNVTRIRDAL